MSLITHCVDCGAPAPVLGRFAGFFGLVEIHSPYCRECIGHHADDIGRAPHEAVAALDTATATCPAVH